MPVLSAVVISRNDEDRIERCVASVVGQVCPVPFEVIVVTSGQDRTADIVRARFPDVRLVQLDGLALPGRARNAGVAVAHGRYLSFPGSHVELPPGSLAARIAAHDQGWAMVTGAVDNGTHTRAGWAAYFLDHADWLPGRPSAELTAAPAHCSYVREHIHEVGGFPEDMRAGEDTVVNTALWQLGHRAYRETSIRFSHANRCTSPVKLIRHHFVRGRALGRIVRQADRNSWPLNGGPRWRFLTGYMNRRLTQTDRRVTQWGEGLHTEYRQARPLVIAGITAAFAGICLDLLTGAKSGSRVRL